MTVKIVSRAEDKRKNAQSNEDDLLGVDRTSRLRVVPRDHVERNQCRERPEAEEHRPDDEVEEILSEQRVEQSVREGWARNVSQGKWKS